MPTSLSTCGHSFAVTRSISSVLKRPSNPSRNVGSSGFGDAFTNLTQLRVDHCGSGLTSIWNSTRILLKGKRGRVTETTDVSCWRSGASQESNARSLGLPDLADFKESQWKLRNARDQRNSRLRHTRGTLGGTGRAHITEPPTAAAVRGGGRGARIASTHGSARGCPEGARRPAPRVARVAALVQQVARVRHIGGCAVY